MSESRLRHFATFQNDEAVVMGYDKTTGLVMICMINRLPGNDQVDLRRIASSESAQNNDYLVPILQKSRHRSGSDWFTHLVQNIKRQNSLVATIPIKELDGMNVEQKAFFKGYGTNIANRPVASSVDIPVSPVDLPEHDVVSDHTAVSPAPLVAPAVDPTLAALLARVVEGQEAMQKSLETLTKQVKPARKTAVKKRTPKAKTNSTAVTEESTDSVTA